MCILLCAYASVLYLDCRASWLPSVVNWTSSYSFHGKDDPDEEMDDEEVYATLKKIEALYEQAKSGIGGGGKVCKLMARTICGSQGVSSGVPPL